MRIVIVGDKSRYQFLRNFADFSKNNENEMFMTERLAETDIFLTADKNLVGENVFFSRVVPLHTEIAFPCEYGLSSITITDTDRVIHFDEFPYCTEEDQNKLDQLLESGVFSQLEVVLFRNERTVLSTDLSTEETAVQKALDEYRKRNIIVHQYSANSSPGFLYWNIVQSQKLALHVFTPLLKEIKFALKVFESKYDLEYVFQIQSYVDDPNVLDGFISYENSMKQKNVFDIYFDRAYGYFIQDNVMIKSFYESVYKECVKNICVWDLQKDLNEIHAMIKTLFVQKVKINKMYIYQGTQRDYALFINSHKEEIVTFKKSIVHFFEMDLKELLKIRIEKNINIIEDYLL